MAADTSTKQLATGTPPAKPLIEETTKRQVMGVNDPTSQLIVARYAETAIVAMSQALRRLSFELATGSENLLPAAQIAEPPKHPDPLTRVTITLCCKQEEGSEQLGFTEHTVGDIHAAITVIMPTHDGRMITLETMIGPDGKITPLYSM